MSCEGTAFGAFGAEGASCSDSPRLVEMSTGHFQSLRNCARNPLGAERSESASGEAKKIDLPLNRELVRELRVGEACLLTGPLYTLRDAGHIRLLEELDAAGSDELPYGLNGQAIFYAGPTPAAAGRPFGAIGPTTASRMDFAAPRLHDAGIAATLGKGVRSQEVKDACARNGAVYFVCVGGAAAYLAKCVTSTVTLAYDDLGTEALRRIEVVDFPVFVGVDSTGADIYDLKG